MLRERTILALLALSLLLLGCPPGSSPDSPLPLLDGACGRYAWLESSEARLTFDQYPYDMDAWPRPEQDQWCASWGDDESDFERCYACDDVGVWLVEENSRTGANCSEITYDEPLLVWRHDAEPGASWTANRATTDEDCEEGVTVSDQGAVIVEVIEEEEIELPAGHGAALVVRRTPSDGSAERWEWISDGLGPVQEGTAETEITRGLVSYEGL